MAPRHGTVSPPRKPVSSAAALACIPQYPQPRLPGVPKMTVWERDGFTAADTEEPHCHLLQQETHIDSIHEALNRFMIKYHNCAYYRDRPRKTKKLWKREFSCYVEGCKSRYFAAQPVQMNKSREGWHFLLQARNSYAHNHSTDGPLSTEMSIEIEKCETKRVSQRGDYIPAGIPEMEPCEGKLVFHEKLNSWALAQSFAFHSEPKSLLFSCCRTGVDNAKCPFRVQAVCAAGRRDMWSISPHSMRNPNGHNHCINDTLLDGEKEMVRVCEAKRIISDPSFHNPILPARGKFASFEHLRRYLRTFSISQRCGFVVRRSTHLESGRRKICFACDHCWEPEPGGRSRGTGCGVSVSALELEAGGAWELRYPLSAPEMVHNHELSLTPWNKMVKYQDKVSY